MKKEIKKKQVLLGVLLFLTYGASNADCVKPIYPGENLWKIVKRIGECLDENTESITSKLDALDCEIQACEHPLFQTDMPYTITAPGIYCLAESVQNTGLNDFLITVSSSDVILDLQEHHMDGGTMGGCAQGAQDGIVVQPGMRNVTIKNGTIANFAAHGINASGVTDDNVQTPIEALFIKDITVLDMSEFQPSIADQLDLITSELDSLSADAGFDKVLECCLGNQFDRLNPAVGIFADCVNNLIIENCKAFNMYGDGIFLRYVQEGLIKNTQAERNGGNGFVFDNCDVTCVQSCKAEQNCYNGFHEVACSGDNSYQECTAKQNGVHGFRVIGSGKTIDSCIANQNTLDGFHVITAKNTTVDGSLDITFGGDGKTIIDFGGTDAAFALAIQKDGKIVSAGSSTILGFSSFALARQNPDGSLDTSFDGDGRQTVSFVASTGASAAGVALQDDGKIVAVGYNQTLLGRDFAVVRLLSDGSLDASFDVDGRVTTNFGGIGDQAQAVAIQKDGKIVVAGYTDASFSPEFALARYNTDGSLDFATTTTFGGVNDRAHALALQKNGKIVVAGMAEISGAGQFALARFNTDGTLDSSFGTGGKVTTSFGNLGDSLNGIAIQKDGKIVAAGWTQTVSGFDLAVARYNIDGSLDASFNGDGKVTTDVANNDFGQAVVIQKDGKIIVVGTTSDDTGSNVDFEIVRYNTDGSLDTTFDGDGKVITDFVGTDSVFAAALQKDGKLVVAGQNIAFGNINLALARYNIFKRCSIIQDSTAMENGRHGFNIFDAQKMTLLRNTSSCNSCNGFIASAPFESNLDIIAKNVADNNMCADYSNIDAALVTVAGAWENIKLN